MTATDEDYLDIEDEDCYSVVHEDAMSWVVDSGASYHITSHKEYFTSYTSGVTGQVRIVVPQQLLARALYALKQTQVADWCSMM